MIPLAVSQYAEDGLLRLAEFVAYGSPTELEVRQVVMGSATVMETYVDAVITNLVEDSGIASSTVGEAMLQEFQGDFSRSWTRRNYWFGVTTGSTFKGERYGQDALLLVDLRNALAHGAGGLSRWQARENDGGFALRSEFRAKLHIEIAGKTLLPSISTARTATVIAREFILKLDQIFLAQRQARQGL